MVRIIILMICALGSGCTTVYVRERTIEPSGGTIAVRGAGWDLETGPRPELIDEAKVFMKSICGKNEFKVLSKSVEPTHAASYYTGIFLGLYSAQVGAEEFRYKFLCI